VGVQINTLDDYIADDRYKLIKLHGSIDWAREVRTVINGIGSMNTWMVANELMARAPDLNVSDQYRTVSEYPIGRIDDKAYFPALAIPVETKRSYECPASHLSALEQILGKVTSILVVGWRGSEEQFIKQVATHCPTERVLVVAAGESDAREVAGRLEVAGVRGHVQISRAGFTDFVINREADPFLAAP
jgi:hypothetical protein